MLKEKMMRFVFLLAACMSILSVLLICVFLFANGMPAFQKIGVLNFLTGTRWAPGNNIYGIAPMIIGTVYVTAGAILVGVPIGIMTAIFMAEFCPKWLYNFLKPAVQLLAGIPSIIYGFFGLVVLAPLISQLFGVSGKNILTASVLLGIMVLPTIISISESAIRAVPRSYYEGARSLGATHEEAVFTAVVPASKSGILAGVVLGIGRAVGETMAVIMICGNQPAIPDGILSGVRTLTANIVLEMGYAADLHREALIATAVVLFVFILLINFIFSALKRREKA